MRNLFLPLLSVLFFTACQKQIGDEKKLKATEQTNGVAAKANDPNAQNPATCGGRVPICHNGNTIIVNYKSLPGHFNHGDRLTCCNINATAWNHDVLTSGGDYSYYDFEVNSCWRGNIVRILNRNAALGYEAYIQVEYVEGAYTISWHFEGQNPPTINDETNIVSQAEYECALAYLRSFIAANPCMPNLCNN